MSNAKDQPVLLALAALGDAGARAKARAFMYGDLSLTTRQADVLLSLPADVVAQFALSPSDVIVARRMGLKPAAMLEQRASDAGCPLPVDFNR